MVRYVAFLLVLGMAGCTALRNPSTRPALAEGAQIDVDKVPHEDAASPRTPGAPPNKAITWREDQGYGYVTGNPKLTATPATAASQLTGASTKLITWPSSLLGGR